MLALAGALALALQVGDAGQTGATDTGKPDTGKNNSGVSMQGPLTPALVETRAHAAQPTQVTISVTVGVQNATEQGGQNAIEKGCSVAMDMIHEYAALMKDTMGMIYDFEKHAKDFAENETDFAEKDKDIAELLAEMETMNPLNPEASELFVQKCISEELFKGECDTDAEALVKNLVLVKKVRGIIETIRGVLPGMIEEESRSGPPDMDKFGEKMEKEFKLPTQDEVESELNESGFQCILDLYNTTGHVDALAEAAPEREQSENIIGHVDALAEVAASSLSTPETHAESQHAKASKITEAEPGESPRLVAAIGMLETEGASQHGAGRTTRTRVAEAVDGSWQKTKAKRYFQSEPA